MLQHADMPTLLRVRATCRDNLTATAKELHRYLHELLAPLVPDVDAFLVTLQANRAFVGGSVAMAFMLRDGSIIPRNLDIFVGLPRGQPMLHYLLTRQAAVDVTVKPATEAQQKALVKRLRARGESQFYCTQTPRATIHLHVSLHDAALLPVTCAWGTPGICYVGPQHFGTPYPSLFFARRGIVASSSTDATPALQGALARCFDIRMFPTQWPDQDDGVCGSSTGVCPMQARRLDDQWALCAQFQPLEARPLSPKIIWRLDGRPCGGQCWKDFETVLRYAFKWRILEPRPRHIEAGLRP
ncbi:hypothetical protein L226DRAFT_470691 [Lentinus tigrinus ALCF2SS1-7]|uniref:Uncharacterized protein n=1 Tax=Lentinus tigrinus ALCF2SS1-6 TaxID=1328759 RepID=A0A5C2RWN5_9APHY|nr:hypothetical protein L227DRAFT_510332 [Lentinus tigrinus ALCF2SS1-6]RPD70155.1 hypothetical protein L226DRAFT_470691 [Lentinus tigrinus ALCF2SS1-7]